MGKPCLGRRIGSEEEIYKAIRKKKGLKVEYLKGMVT
jgi:hypothetical protein